ncbi:MAG: hypothetical protein IJ049_05200 [Oscillospiraceae bacterium]|nr:hypothetical protein [Oscillospiraceae bacterium]
MSEQTKRKRPQIIVERVYVGEKSMKQVFRQIATAQVQKNWSKHTSASEG